MSSERARPPTKIAAGKFHIGKKLGAGCFGEVYRGYNTVTQEEVAVKFEDFRSQQLEHEADILQALLKPESPQGFAQSFYFGQEGRFQCMVIELLGRFSSPWGLDVFKETTNERQSSTRGLLRTTCSNVGGPST